MKDAKPYNLGMIYTFFTVAGNLTCKVCNSSTNISKRTNCLFAACHTVYLLATDPAAVLLREREECEMTSLRDEGRRKKNKRAALTFTLQ